MTCWIDVYIYTHDFIHKFLIEMAKNKSDTDSSDSYQISEQIWLGHIGTTICHILGTAVVDPLIGLGGVYCCIDPGSHVLQEQLGRVLQRNVC